MDYRTPTVSLMYRHPYLYHNLYSALLAIGDNVELDARLRQSFIQTACSDYIGYKPEFMIA